MSDLRFVYMTAGSEDQAKAIARRLVEQRLAACVNILGTITSVYRWQGAVTEDNEIALIAKTRADLVPGLTDAVKEIHDYDVPCVIALPIEDGQGNPDFLEWIKAME